MFIPDNSRSPLSTETALNPQIESFRGLAALMVLIHHYTYGLPEAWQPALKWTHFFHNGVDLFFVITGFLFASYMLGLSAMRVQDFLVRRIFRLYPLYVVSLVVAAIYTHGELSEIMLALIKHLVFIQALPFFSLADASYFSLVYWTLPVEMAFYGLVVLALLYFSRPEHTDGRQQRATRALLVYGLIAWLLFVVFYAWRHDTLDPNWVLRQAQLPAILIEFWFGLILFRSLPALRRDPRSGAMMLLVGSLLLGGLFVYYAYFDWIALTPRPFGWFNVWSALAYALLLGGILLTETAQHSVWVSRILPWFGAISYAVYLFHEWVLRILQSLMPTVAGYYTISIAFATTILLAWGLHRWIEMPMRRIGRRITTTPSQQAAKNGQ